MLPISVSGSISGGILGMHRKLASVVQTHRIRIINKQDYYILSTFVVVRFQIYIF